MSTAASYTQLPEPVYQYIDGDGNVQKLPDTITPPAGESPLWAESGRAGSPYGQHQEPPFDPQSEHELTEAYVYTSEKGLRRVDEWVNPYQPGIPGLGPIRAQAPQGGHTASVVPNPAAEQGWGMDPAVLNSRWPVMELPNPFHSQYIQKRSGSYPVVSNPPALASHLGQHGQAAQLQWVALRRRGRHGVLADVPAAVPYSANVAAVQSLQTSSLDSLMPAGIDHY